MDKSQIWRSRWAAVGAAVAVSLGAGGAWVTHAASPPSSLVMIQPARILDTRNPTNLGLAGPFTSAVSQDLQVTGSIPTGTGIAIVVPSGATGVLLNVTPVGPEAGGFISIRPADASGKPTTSNLNFDTGQINPNSVQVEVPTTGADAGEIEITYDAFGRTGPATDVLVDVVGYTVAAGGGPDPAIGALEARVAELELSAPFTVANSDSSPRDVPNSPTVILGTVITAPTDGQITVFSTTTLGEDVAGEEMRCSITTGSTVEVPFLQRWESGGPNSGQHASLTGVRTFNVSAGTMAAYRLVCEHAGGAGSTGVLEATVVSAIFTPTR